jgi:hypothetical protein
MPPRHEPNTTRLGSNEHKEIEISHYVQKNKHAKNRDADCKVCTVHTDDDMACPYNMW